MFGSMADDMNWMDQGEDDDDDFREFDCRRDKRTTESELFKDALYDESEAIK